MTEADTIATWRARLDSTLKDRALIIAERDDARLAVALMPAQCCMCGKTGLSVDEDGGPECQLDDGRWVCSGDCWDKASALDGGEQIPLADHKTAVAEAYQRAADLLADAGVAGDTDDDPLRSMVLALADTDALAEVQKMRADLARVTAERNEYVVRWGDMCRHAGNEGTRAEAAEAKLVEREAQVERLLEAQADQDQKLKDADARADAAVTVKPLVWQGGAVWPGTAWAVGFGGSYQINEQDADQWLMTKPNGDSAMFDKYAEATAAADADHDAAIRAAIGGVE